MARPKLYDEDEVVEKAVAEFWKNGFAHSSVDNLTGSISRHSLYRSLGGKEGLFKKAIARVVDQYSSTYLSVLDKYRGIDAVRAYFDSVTRHEDARGCLLVNSIVELGRSNRMFHKLVAHYYDLLVEKFSRVIVQGQTDGSIRRDLDPRETAKWILHIIQGQAVHARFGGEKSNVDGLIALLAVAPSPAGEKSR